GFLRALFGLSCFRGCICSLWATPRGGPERTGLTLPAPRRHEVLEGSRRRIGFLRALFGLSCFRGCICSLWATPRGGPETTALHLPEPLRPWLVRSSPRASSRDTGLPARCRDVRAPHRPSSH